MRYFNKIALIYDKEEQDAREKADLRRRQANAARNSAITSAVLGLGIGGYALRQKAVANSLGELHNRVLLNELPSGTPTREDLFKVKDKVFSTNGKFIADDYASRSIPNKILSYFGFGPKNDISNVPHILASKKQLADGNPYTGISHALASLIMLRDPQNREVGTSYTHAETLEDIKKAQGHSSGASDTAKNLALAVGLTGLVSGGAWAYNKYKQNQHEKEIQNVRNKERQYSIDHPVRYNLKRLGL